MTRRDSTAITRAQPDRDPVGPFARAIYTIASDDSPVADWSRDPLSAGSLRSTLAGWMHPTADRFPGGYLVAAEVAFGAAVEANRVRQSLEVRVALLESRVEQQFDECTRTIRQLQKALGVPTAARTDSAEQSARARAAALVLAKWQAAADPEVDTKGWSRLVQVLNAGRHPERRIPE